MKRKTIVIGKPKPTPKCYVKFYENGLHRGQITVYRSADEVKAIVAFALNEKFQKEGK